MSKKVILLLAEGFEEIEALSIVDILRRANIDVTMVALGTLHVTGTHGVVVVADALLKEVDTNSFDMIVLPGGLPGATNLATDVNVQTLLRSFDAEEKAIAAICAAPYALHTAGVLKKRYTCYPGFQENIGHEGYTDATSVVIDANITTSKGPSTAIAFALSLVEQLISKECAVGLSKELLLV